MKWSELQNIGNELQFLRRKNPVGCVPDLLLRQVTVVKGLRCAQLRGLKLGYLN